MSSNGTDASDAELLRLHHTYGKVIASFSSREVRTEQCPDVVRDAVLEAGKCCVCGFTPGSLGVLCDVERGYRHPQSSMQPISCAHVLKTPVEASAIGVTFADRGNFLPLCGVKHSVPSCHSAFDLGYMTLRPTGNDSEFEVLTNERYKYLRAVVNIPHAAPRALEAHSAFAILNHRVDIMAAAANSPASDGSPVALDESSGVSGVAADDSPTAPPHAPLLEVAQVLTPVNIDPTNAAVVRHERWHGLCVALVSSSALPHVVCAGDRFGLRSNHPDPVAVSPLGCKQLVVALNAKLCGIRDPPEPLASLGVEMNLGTSHAASSKFLPLDAHRIHQLSGTSAGEPLVVLRATMKVGERVFELCVVAEGSSASMPPVSCHTGVQRLHDVVILRPGCSADVVVSGSVGKRQRPPEGMLRAMATLYSRVAPAGGASATPTISAAEVAAAVPSAIRMTRFSVRVGDEFAAGALTAFQYTQHDYDVTGAGIDTVTSGCALLHHSFGGAGNECHFPDAVHEGLTWLTRVDAVAAIRYDDAVVPPPDWAIADIEPRHTDQCLGTAPTLEVAAAGVKLMHGGKRSPRPDVILRRAASAVSTLIAHTIPAGSMDVVGFSRAAIAVSLSECHAASTVGRTTYGTTLTAPRIPELTAMLAQPSTSEVVELVVEMLSGVIVITCRDADDRAVRAFAVRNRRLLFDTPVLRPHSAVALVLRCTTDATSTLSGSADPLFAAATAACSNNGAGLEAAGVRSVWRRQTSMVEVSPGASIQQIIHRRTWLSSAVVASDEDIAPLAARNVDIQIALQGETRSQCVDLSDVDVAETCLRAWLRAADVVDPRGTVAVVTADHLIQLMAQRRHGDRLQVHLLSRQGSQVWSLPSAAASAAHPLIAAVATGAANADKFKVRVDLEIVLADGRVIDVAMPRHDMVSVAGRVPTLPTDRRVTAHGTEVMLIAPDEAFEPPAEMLRVASALYKQHLGGATVLSDAGDVSHFSVRVSYEAPLAIASSGSVRVALDTRWNLAAGTSREAVSAELRLPAGVEASAAAVAAVICAADEGQLPLSTPTHEAACPTASTLSDVVDEAVLAKGGLSVDVPHIITRLQDRGVTTIDDLFDSGDAVADSLDGVDAVTAVELNGASGWLRRSQLTLPAPLHHATWITMPHAVPGSRCSTWLSGGEPAAVIYHDGGDAPHRLVVGAAAFDVMRVSEELLLLRPPVCRRELLPARCMGLAHVTPETVLRNVDGCVVTAVDASDGVRRGAALFCRASVAGFCSATGVADPRSALRVLASKAMRM
jgi:hypothetical protein